MILPDTSIWIDQLRAGDPELIAQLEIGTIVIHPWVIGEIALGNLAHRSRTLQALKELPAAPIVAIAEVFDIIEERSLHGLGIGYVDVQILASALAVPGTMLWTRDQRLHSAATRLGMAHGPWA